MNIDNIPVTRIASTTPAGEMESNIYICKECSSTIKENRSFVCKGCLKRVQEKKHGAGFQNCGAVIADKEYMLCPRCLSIVMELLEAMPDSLKLGRFTSELIVACVEGER